MSMRKFVRTFRAEIDAVIRGYGFVAMASTDPSTTKSENSG